MQNTELGNILKVHCCCYEENIYPWVQNRLMTPYWRFYWNPVPGGFLRFGEEEVALVPEYFYILPGYLEFSTVAREPFAQFYIHFNLSDRQVSPRRMFQIPTEKETLGLIHKFIVRKNSMENRQLTLLSALAVLTPSLLRLPENILCLPPERDPRIERVINWILAHRDRMSDNSSLAELAGMSRNGFLRLFESETGEPPQVYCRRKRIELACELLHFSDFSLEEIAEASGFSDRYHFSRVFSRVLRSTPASFRRQVRGRGHLDRRD